MKLAYLYLLLAIASVGLSVAALYAIRSQEHVTYLVLAVTNVVAAQHIIHLRRKDHRAK